VGKHAQITLCTKTSLVKPARGSWSFFVGMSTDAAFAAMLAAPSQEMNSRHPAFALLFFSSLHPCWLL
jgi:hypothetical protein